MSKGISISLKITGPGDEVEVYGRMVSTDELMAAKPEIDALKAKLHIGMSNYEDLEANRAAFYATLAVEAQEGERL